MQKEIEEGNLVRSLEKFRTFHQQLHFQIIGIIRREPKDFVDAQSEGITA
jgi:hypothetical protein